MRKKFVTLFTLIVLVISSAFTVWAETPRTMYVMSSASRSLSKMNMETGGVLQDVVLLGETSNQVLVNNNKIYVVNSGTDDIMIIDAENDQAVQQTIALDIGSNPWAMDFISNDMAYVSNFLDNSVSVIDFSTGQATKKITVGTAPEGVFVMADAALGTKAFITNTGYAGWNQPYAGSSVSIINVANDSVTHTIDMPVNPQDIAIDSWGRLHVMCTGDYGENTGKIAILSMYTGDNWNEPGVVATVDIGGQPGDIVVTPDGKGYCVAWGDGTNGYLYVYDALADTVIHGADDPILIGPNVSNLVYDNKENCLWIPYMAEWGGDSYIQKFDLESESVVWQSPLVCAGAQALAILEPILDTDAWADGVVSFTAGAEWNHFGENFFPQNVLGPPDPSPNIGPYSPSAKAQELLSLGNGGEIVLEFSNNVIENGDGADFTIFENPFISYFDGSVNCETGIVSVSQDGENWVQFPYDAETLIGLAGVTPTGDTQNPTDPAVSGGDQFDLADVGLAWARFVKITDAGDLVVDSGDFDLDAVVAINSAKEPTSVEDNEHNVPEQFTLEQNYPNPFNGQTSIEFLLNKNNHVSVEIYNTNGQLVKTLMNKSVQAGAHRVVWDGRDNQNLDVVSGLYLAVLKTPVKQKMIKMSFIK